MLDWGWQPCLKVSTTTNFKISIKNQSFIVLGGLKCVKLANNVIKVTNKKNTYNVNNTYNRSIDELINNLIRLNNLIAGHKKIEQNFFYLF